MFKNTHIKTIITFLILGVVIITALGIVQIQSLNEINSNLLEAEEKISQAIQNTMQITIVLDIVYSVLCLLIAIITSRIVDKPITKLLKDADKVITSNNKKEKKNKNTDEIVDTFHRMTDELQENLNEMSRQKRQIETIILHMTDGIIAFDMEGKVILINPAASRLLQVLPTDDSFKKIFNSKLNIDINMEKIIYLENWTSTEQKVKVGDRVLNLFFAQFKDEKDRPSGIMVMIQDITEHVKLDEMRKEFVADVSHELKTPITSIMGYSERFLKVIATESRRMAKLVTDLLTLSRFDNNQILQEKTMFDLGTLVKQCQENLEIQVSQKNHKMECFVTADVPPVYADREGIERVVINILTNSIKYTPEGGSIKIYVGFVYNDAYIKVIDNGIGIPEDDLNRIFERFYRVDKARTRKMGGTGLGLSIAKEILDRNNGSIDIKSEEGKGTEVVIRIPTKK